jgi:hypothetical protein
MVYVCLHLTSQYGPATWVYAYHLLRVGRVSVATRRCLLGLLGSAVLLVSVWLPTSAGLSVYCCLGRHYVLKSLVTPR